MSLKTGIKLRQKGQAMAETVVTVVSVLIPLAIMLPALSAIFDMQNSVHQASRYVSWERVVGRHDGVSEQEVRSRFYKDPLNGLTVITDKVNPLWNAGSPIFDECGQLAVYAGTEVSSYLVRNRDTVVAPFPNFGDEIDWTTQHYAMLGLDATSVGYVEAGINMEIGPKQEYSPCLNGNDGTVLNLAAGARLRSRGGIITDSWVPSNEDQFRRRVSGAVPFDNETLEDITSLTGYIPVIGDIPNTVPILKGLESALIVRDNPLYSEVFNDVFPELGSASEGGFNMTNEELSTLLPN
ncbi:MAG: hypothetical protein JKY67_16535 [Pseudomonadales bacterium]|nr:hypothetical protein [Pseudomonadales bacterium]